MMKLNDMYSSYDGKIFKIKGVYTKDDESDPWVDYVNNKTGQEYSCRQEAFLSRFSILPESK